MVIVAAVFDAHGNAYERPRSSRTQIRAVLLFGRRRVCSCLSWRMELH